MADELDDDAEGDHEVPEGAAIFPLIPAELGVDPLLLAVIHATIFLAGSDPDVVHPAAADEAVQTVAEYLQRLGGEQRERVREDMETLAAYARQEKWPRGMIHAVQSFLSDLGIGGEDEA